MPSAPAPAWEKVVRTHAETMPPDDPRPPTRRTRRPRVPRARARRGRYRAAERGRRTAVPAPHAHRIRELDPRSPCARSPACRARLRAAPPRRQREQRLRQHRRPLVRLAGRDGTLHRRGAETRADCGRRHADAGAREHLQALGAAAAGRARRGAVVRHARRPRHRDVLFRSTPTTRSTSRRHRARARSTRSRRHRRRASGGAEDRCGYAGSAARGGSRIVPRAGAGRPASLRRDLRRTLRSARREPRAQPHAQPRHAARDGHRDDPRAVFAHRARRHAEPPAHLHLPAERGGHGDAVRAPDPDHARVARLSPVATRRPRGPHAVLRAGPSRRRVRAGIQPRSSDCW